MLKTCHRSDPNLNDCVKEAIEDLRPFLAKGKTIIPTFIIFRLNKIQNVGTVKKKNCCLRVINLQK